MITLKKYNIFQIAQPCTNQTILLDNCFINMEMTDC